jgi:hypothetical protein
MTEASRADEGSRARRSAYRRHLQPVAANIVTNSSIIRQQRRCMSIFQIRQKTSGAILWTGSADTEQVALDAMAREAGYRDFASLPESIRGTGIETAKLDMIS